MENYKIQEKQEALLFHFILIWLLSLAMGIWYHSKCN